MRLIDTVNISIMRFARYASGAIYPDDIHETLPVYEISWQDTSGTQRFKIPFCYSTNGREYRAAMKTKSGIWYRDVRHTTNMSKALPEWHRPEELLDMLGSDPQNRISGLPITPE